MKNPFDKQKIKRNKYILIYALVMAIIYSVEMFVNKPWYDELYTYYSFVSRGPVYAAIHWPVPNNHMGYSVLAAILNVFGNPYVGLRGVSVIASVANILLIYSFSRRFLRVELATSVSVLYAGANLVHSLAFQGRGYSLAITCYLSALICMYCICMNLARKRHYIIYALMMAYGLYILPSSVYWVLQICLVGGLYLVFCGKWKQLIKLVIASLAAAVLAGIAYSMVWLAIGSNLLCKDPSSAYYGIYQLRIIAANPLLSLKTGMEYMLATPYIQSISKSDAVFGMPAYFKDLFDYFYNYCGISMCLLYGVLAVFAVFHCVVAFGKKRNAMFAGIYIGISLITTPIMLIIQSVHPYKRVLSFFMVPFAFATMYGISLACHYRVSAKQAERGARLTLILVVIVCGGLLALPSYRTPLAGRENDIEDVLKQIDVADIDSIYYMDDYQKYVLKFYHDAEPIEATLEDAEYVLVPCEVKADDYEAAEWPILVSHKDANIGYVEKYYEVIASSDKYDVCKRLQ